MASEMRVFGHEHYVVSEHTWCLKYTCDFTHVKDVICRRYSLVTTLGKPNRCIVNTNVELPRKNKLNTINLLYDRVRSNSSHNTYQLTFDSAIINFFTPRSGRTRQVLDRYSTDLASPRDSSHTKYIINNRSTNAAEWSFRMIAAAAQWNWRQESKTVFAVLWWIRRHRCGTESSSIQ